MCQQCQQIFSMGFGSVGRPQSKPEQFSDRGGDLVVGDLMVYRQWGFGAMGPRLTGLALSVPWPDGEMRADCWKSDWAICPESPGAQCGCGIWGYYRPDEDWSTSGLFSTLYGSGTTVWGVAKVGGRCLLGGRGLRAARATPLAVVIDGAGPAKDALSRYYPSVRTFTAREQLLEAYPPSDWESLVGPLDPSPMEAYRREQEKRRARQHLAQERLWSRAGGAMMSYADFAAYLDGPTPEAEETRPGPAKPKGPTPPQKAYGPASGRNPFRRRGRG